MPKRSRKVATPKARVIPDTRNGQLDFFIPLKVAKQLFEEGKLARDITNDAWAPTKKMSVLDLRALAVKE